MTGIEWVLNPDGTRGITVNSKTGCLNHTPEGLCLGGLFPCYAFKLAHGRLKRLYSAKTAVYTGFDSSGMLDPFYPRFWPERLDKIRGLKKPTGIFLDDMSDWMGDYWPEEWTRQEIQVMRDCPQHRFYTLTKQPQNLPQWDFPENCWVGVTATKWLSFSNALGYLMAIKAKVKYLSFEPMLERIQLDMLQRVLFPNVIEWIIIGACTGTMEAMSSLVGRYFNLTLMHWKGNIWTAQPRIEWVKEIVEAADKAGIPVFLKDNLKPLLIPEDCSKPNYLTDDIFWASEKAQLRQEMPTLKLATVL